MQPELLYILEICKVRNFTKAANNLCVSQPALSIAIKKIEKRIGMPLFDRSCQPIELTAAGQIYLKNILAMQNLEKNLHNALQDLSTLEAGNLRLAGTQFFNSHVLPDTIKAYAERYPKVNVSLIEDNNDKLDPLLNDGTVDITFHGGRFNAELYRGEEVFKDYLLLAVPRTFSLNQEITACGLNQEQVRQNFFLQAACPVISLSVFSQLPFLILTEKNDLRTRSLAICTAAGFSPQIKFCADQLETAHHMARHGLGTTFVSDRLVKDVPAPELLYFKLTAPEAIRHFHAITRKNCYISNIMQAFMTMLQKTWQSTANAPTQAKRK